MVWIRSTSIAWVALTAGLVTAQRDAIALRWRALHANCSSVATRTRYEDASVAEATALFDDVDLPQPIRSRWFHDLGEWHLLQGGNVSRAEEFLQASTDLGDRDAQFLVGALAATSPTPDPAKAAVYYQFAARAGSTSASMALGFRHLVGYDAPRSCETALRHYKTVADDVMRHNHGLPNRALPIQVFSTPPPFRLSDDQTQFPQTDQDERDLVEYLRQRAASSMKVDLLVRTASLILFSDLYQHGSTADVEAHHEASHLLQRAAKLGSSPAKALLGHVYAYGLVGSHVDIPRAIQLYEEAYNSSNSTSHPDDRSGRSEAANGLGLLYLRGHDGLSEVERAMAYFQTAARDGHANGVFNAATVMAQTDPRRAMEYLEASADVGHVGALFKLARAKEKERFRGSNDLDHGCTTIAETYKQVAEHNVYGRHVLKQATEAFINGRYEQSLRLYRIAAELGYEVAEQNAAWLIERYKFSSLFDAINSHTYNQLVRRGVIQRQVDAVLRAADLEFTKGNYRLAMKHYLQAMEIDPTHPRALYSAGYMCEWGLGTVHKGRSPERARWYYEQAQHYEPLLGYVLPVLIYRIDVELKLMFWVEKIASIMDRVMEFITAWLNLTTVQKKREIVFDEPTMIASDQPVELASAMLFDGVTSVVTVETTAPPQMDALTLETMLWIEKPSTHEDHPPVQVLFEWPETLRVELIPYSDGTSWQIRILGLSSYESVLTLTKFALRQRRWYQITVSVDAVKSKATLLVDGNAVDSGNLLSRFPSEAGRTLIHIGHPPHLSGGPQSNFHGKFLHYRVRHKSVPSGNDATNTEETDGALWIDVKHDIHGHEEQEGLIDTQQGTFSSHIASQGVDLRFVRVPHNP